MEGGGEFVECPFFVCFIPTISLRGPVIPHLHGEGRSPEFLYGGKSAQQLSYGFNILEVLESYPHENQIP